MLKLNHKIQAFTLFELLVVITVIAVVISISLAMYVNLNKSFANKDYDKEQSKEFMFFYTLFSSDFFNAQEIKGNEKRLELTTNHSRIQYYFYPEKIIRKNGIDEEQFHLFYDFSGVIYNIYNSHFIETAELEFYLNSLVVPISLKKEYTNLQLFEFAKQE